jgi:hypothetical protein
MKTAHPGAQDTETNAKEQWLRFQQHCSQFFAPVCPELWPLLAFPSHHITSHHITSHHITLHYITLHYITLHYITLHYITLHYITSMTTRHFRQINFCIAPRNAAGKHRTGKRKCSRQFSKRVPQIEQFPQNEIKRFSRRRTRCYTTRLLSWYRTIPQSDEHIQDPEAALIQDCRPYGVNVCIHPLLACNFANCVHGPLE